MSFMVSPGVEVREIDLTGYIPAVSTSIGAYAGHFRWGPVDEIVRIGDEKQLARNFGTPTEEYAQSYYIPSSFLRYGERLIVSRAGDDNMKNARTGSLWELNKTYYSDLTEEGGPYENIDNLDELLEELIGGEETVRIENKRIFEAITQSNLDSNIYARCMGEMGNSLKIMIQPAYTDTRWNVVEIRAEETTFENDHLGVTLTIQHQIVGQDEDTDSPIYNDGIADYSPISLRGLASNLDWVGYMQALGRTFYVKKVSDDGSATFTSSETGYTNEGLDEWGYPVGTTYTRYRVYIDQACEIKFDPRSIYRADRFGRTFSQDIPTFNSGESTPLMSQGFAYWPPQTEDFETAFASKPGTSAFAEERGIKNDEIHVLIIDAGGEFTGTPGTVLERYENLSLLSNAHREDGSSSYYRDVINDSSRYILINNLTGVIAMADMTSTQFVKFNITEALSEVGPEDLSIYSVLAEHDKPEFVNQFPFGSIYAIRLVDGSDGDAGPQKFKNGNVFKALELFEDPEEIDLNLIFAENDSRDNITVANKLIKIAERRKDCVAFISPDLAVKDMPNESSKLDQVLRKFNRLPSTSYAVFDSTPIQVYDKYNDEYIWISACGTAAGLCARTDKVRDPWWSPAGYSRGQLLGVANLAFNPKKFARDELYKARVNPIVAFPGEGTILYGDKTAQARPSAFDRINVRRLFIVLQKAISTAAKYSLFEFNDEFTRASFKNMVEPYLRDVQGRRGIYDFHVVCDETNNTPEVIDTNRFIADIYIKPARSINFITLNFIATRTGVEFSEVIGKW